MSTNEYARQRGREPPSTAPLPQAKEGRKPGRPLTEREQVRAAENRALVREHLPEALPFIKDLVDEGLIDGWRNVESVEVFADHNEGGQP